MASSATRLHDTLTELLQSHTTSNAALNEMLGDYRRYHIALAVGGGLCVLVLVGVSAICWRSFRRARTPTTGQKRSRAERRVWLVLAAAAAVVAILTLVVVAANISTAVDPRPGFALLVNSLPRVPNSHFAPIYASADQWLHSARSQVPALLQQQVHARLSWQRPKAIYCGIGLVLAATATTYVWRRRIEELRAGAAPRLVGMLHSSIGILTAGATVVLIVMTIANAQASVAPLTISTFGA